MGPSIYEFQVFGNLTGASASIGTEATAFHKSQGKQADIAVNLKCSEEAARASVHCRGRFGDLVRRGRGEHLAGAGSIQRGVDGQLMG